MIVVLAFLIVVVAYTVHENYNWRNWRDWVYVSIKGLSAIFAVVFVLLLSIGLNVKRNEPFSVTLKNIETKLKEMMGDD